MYWTQRTSDPGDDPIAASGIKVGKIVIDGMFRVEGLEVVARLEDTRWLLKATLERLPAEPREFWTR